MPAIGRLWPSGDDDGGGCELCKLDHQELLTKSLALHQRLKYHIDNDDDGDDDGDGDGVDDGGDDDGGGSGGGGGIS